MKCNINDILVQPRLLLNIASDLILRARRIRSALIAADQIMQQLDITQFEGMRALALLTRYRNNRDAFERWPGIIERFSKDLQATANLFEKADRSK